MEEIWMPVEGYEESYNISSLGRIKSLPKLHRNSEKILKPIYTREGYLAIDLGDGVSIKRHLMHRVVAQAFIPNPEDKPQVNHINGIKDDNRLVNLEWNTRSENQKHSIRIGLRTAKGEKNSQAVLDEVKVKEIRELLTNSSLLQKEIAEMYGISMPTITDIKKRRSWKHI